MATDGEGPVRVAEEALEPDLAICDAHHHLWDRPDGRYMCDDFIEDARGHRVVSTVFVECMAGYRSDGPEATRPVGETAFGNDVAGEGLVREPGGGLAAGVWGLGAAACGQLYPLDVVAVGDGLEGAVAEDGLQGEPDLCIDVGVAPPARVDVVEPRPFAVVGELKFLGPQRTGGLVG